MRPEQTAFEVRCNRCSVSYPVGTRACMHCGERLGRASAARSALAGLRPAEPGEMEPEAEEEELSGRRGVMSPVAILWVVLLVGGAIYRLCSGAN